MTETASLVIKVDSSGAKRATADLDALAKQGGRTEAAAGRMSAGFGALGRTLVGLGAGVAVGKFLGSVIRNTIEAEQVQAQLAARIKSTGQAAGLALGDLNAMAKGLQRTSVYGDEAIGSAQALLLTFTKIGRETFPEALQAVLNVATAMGTDLNSAALQVGKALNDPVAGLGALSRAGIQFTDDQKAVIKALVETGREAEAQKIILGELSTQMGGAASAAADTLGGRISQLKEAFGDLLEGDSGGGGVKGVKGAIESLIATMNDPGVQSGFATMTRGMFSLVDAAAQAIGAIGNLIGKYNELLGQKGLTRGSESDSLNTLIARRDRLTAAQAKRGGNGFAGANDPIGKLLGVDKTLSAEIARVNGLISAQLKNSSITQADIFRLPIPSGLPVPYATGGFNFAADMATRGRMPSAGGGASPASRSGGSSSSVGGAAPKAIPSFMPDIEDTQRAIEAVTRARDAFDSMAATLAGPLQDALYRHNEAMRELTELGATGEIAAEDIDKAKALEEDRYKAQKLEIEMRGTNIDLMSEEARAALALADAKRQAVDLMDSFRMGASDALTDIVTGAKSATDALRDFFDSIAAQITSAIADNWMAKLFGPQGSTGGGTSGGNWLSSIFGALLGGGPGFAGGGYTGPGSMATPAGIVHKGEVVWSQSDVARAGGVGAVEAMRRGGSRGGCVVQNVYVQGRPDKSTMKQLERASGRGAAREMARTGR